MASKVKVTVSVDAGLMRELSGASRKRRKPHGALSPERLRSVDSAIQVSLDVP